MEITLLFARHLESTYNQRGLLTGWHNPPLSKRGQEQASMLGQLLAQQGHRRFDAVLCSDLLRSLQSLEIILERGDIRVGRYGVHPGLREVHFGHGDGSSKQEFLRSHPEEGYPHFYTHHPEYDFRSLGGERRCEVVRRQARAIVAELEPLYRLPTVTVLVIGHKAALNSLLETLDLTPKKLAEQGSYIRHTLPLSAIRRLAERPLP